MCLLGIDGEIFGSVVSVSDQSWRSGAVRLRLKKKNGWTVVHLTQIICNVIILCHRQKSNSWQTDTHLWTLWWAPEKWN